MQSSTNSLNSPIKLLVALSFSVLFCIGCRTKATILAWESATTKEEFPEAKLDLPSTGVCFSGGGTRAMNLALGQMAGLRELDLWDDIGYISAVSGGSWASTIFTYYNAGAENDDQLLGNIIKDPQKITMDTLKYMPDGFMGEVITKHLVDDVFLRLAEGSLTFGTLQKMDYVWIDAVGSTYLAPYGLYDPKHPKYFTLNNEVKNDILARNRKLKADDFITVHKQEGDIKRPFLIVNSSLLAPSRYLPLKNPENLSVFNYTPLYIGSNNPIGVTDTELLSGKTISFNAGGGFVESFGFGSELLRSQKRQLSKDGTQLRVKLAKQRFEAVDATGTSSAAYGAIFSSSLIAQLASYLLTPFSADQMIPEEAYWPISSNGVIEDAARYRFTDGGNLENYGLISLLQRGVEKVVVFINTDTPLDVSITPSAECPPLASQVSSDLFPLFGYKIGNQTKNQVFKKSDFTEVYESLRDAKLNKQSVIAKTTLQTVENKWWGIQPNQEVTVLWVYNESVPEWEDQLPKEVKEQICAGPDGAFPAFPLYKLIGENGLLNWISLTKEQVNLLYQFSAWNVYSNRDVFDFLKNSQD